jgi:hypothetical protein
MYLDAREMFVHYILSSLVALGHKTLRFFPLTTFCKQVDIFIKNNLYMNLLHVNPLSPFPKVWGGGEDKRLNRRKRAMKYSQL